MVAPEVKLETVRLSLPGFPKSFVNLQYYDSMPQTNPEKQVPTIIATHGYPGSHKDFKYIVPSLLAWGYRVIIPNWPGLGITDNPPDDQFDHSNLVRAKLLTSFVRALNLHKIDLVMGHSAGCYPYPLFFCDNLNLCKAAVFIAPGGATPHQGLRPYWATRFTGWLLTTWLKPWTSRFLFLFTTKILNMKIAHHTHAAVLTRMAANIDFIFLNEILSTTKTSKNPPIVLVCGKEDHLVEKEKSIEYAEKLGCHEHDGIYHVAHSGQVDEVIRKIFSPTGRLDRHYAILFERGTHFVQKHEADSICKLIKTIIESNKV